MKPTFKKINANEPYETKSVVSVQKALITNELDSIQPSQNNFSLFKLFLFSIIFVIPFYTFSQTNYDFSWQYFRPGNTGIQGDMASALWIDENGDPYIAASTGNWGEGGFAKFIQSENRWINYSNVDYPVLGSFDNADIQILDIIEDFDKNLWFGSFLGAIRFNPVEGSSSLERFDPSNSPLQGYTTAVDLAPDSSIWFTSGHLVQYNPKTNEWNSWESSNTLIAIQPTTDGNYLVWSAESYYGYVFTYNSATNEYVTNFPTEVGDIAGLPGKDCVDDSGNFWALRMASDGDFETLEYQKPDGSWVHPVHPYSNLSFYIDSFKAFGNGKAILVTSAGETWYYDGLDWNNYGTWRPGDLNQSVDMDELGNVWVCGSEGAAKRDVNTGQWQRYRITNSSQIDYFVQDISVGTDGNIWFTGNAGSGYGGFQKYDGTRWTGFNEYTYGLGFPFPYQADNTQAILSRPSNGEIVFNPTFNGIHVWNGVNYYSIENILSTSKGFAEDSQGRVWTVDEYGGIRYFDEPNNQWISFPLTASAGKITTDPNAPGTIWASTDYELIRTDGNNEYRILRENIPGSSELFTGLAIDENSNAWIGTFLPFSTGGSTLHKINPNTGEITTWSYDEGWPFPGEHVRPFACSPDGLIWLQYDSEYPTDIAGICWFDGTNVGIFPSAPGGEPQWGGLPNSNIKDLEVKEIDGGYELWMSCQGRGIAVLKVITNTVAVEEKINPTDDFFVSATPNPTNQSVQISFSSVDNHPSTVAIFNIQGEKIIEIPEFVHHNGLSSAIWNLKNESGTRVSNGIYLAKVSNNQYTKSIKIIVKE